MALRFVATSSATPRASDLLAALHHEYDVAAGRELHYRGAGYSEIADYNDNPFGDHWAEKRL